jgi:hypothetical protein
MLDPEPPARFAKAPGAQGGAVIGQDAAHGYAVRLVKTDTRKQEGTCGNTTPACTES